MKKFTKVLAALGAVAMLGLGVFTSCKSDDGDDDNYVKVFYPNGTTMQSLLGNETVDLTADSAWASKSINIGSASKIAKDELDEKVIKNSDINAVLQQVATDAGVEVSALTLAYYSDKYSFDESGAISGAAISAEIPKGKAYLYAYYAAPAETTTKEVTLGTGDTAITITVTTAADGTVTAKTADGTEVTVTTGEDGSTTYKVGEDTYVVSADGSATKNGEKIDVKEETKFTADTKTVSTTDLGGSAESAESSDTSVATVSVESGAVKITSAKAGTATVTAKATGYSDASISVTVAESGAITATVTTKFVADDTPEVAPDPQVIVNATWNFKDNITGLTASSSNETAKFGAQTADTDLEGKGTNDLGNSDLGDKEIGAGLKILKASGDLKWKYEDEYDYGLYSGTKGTTKVDGVQTYTYEGDATSYAISGDKNGYDNADYLKGKLELTTEDSAKITLKVSGNGDEDPNYHRWVVVTNAAGKIVGKLNGLKKNGGTDNGNIVELKLNDGELVKADTYTIWMNGSRLNEVIVKNDISENPSNVAVTSVIISGDAARSVALDGTIEFTATVSPSSATDKTVTWSIASGATATEATINASTGVFSAGSVAGTASVIATAGGVPSAAVVVTVKEEEDTSVYTYDADNATISLLKSNVGTIAGTANEGGSAYLSVSEDQWNNTVNYNMSSTSRTMTIKVKGVAAFTVSIKGSKTEARNFTVKIGDATALTASHLGTNSSDVVDFTFNTGTTDETTIVLGGGGSSVYPQSMTVYNTAQSIPATKVTISGKPDSTLVLSDGTSYDKLTVTLTPSWTTDTVTWSSGTESVATIDANGKLTLVAKGSTEIIAKANNTVSDKFTLSVADADVKVTSITVAPATTGATGTIYAEDTLQLAATTNTDATNQAVTWKVTNGETYASVDSDGLVTGLAEGTATITATAADGSGVTGTYDVTVKGIYKVTYLTYTEDSETVSYIAAIVGSELEDANTTGLTVTPANADKSKLTGTPTMGKGYAANGLLYTNTAGDWKYTSNTEFVSYTFTVKAKSKVTLKNFTYSASCSSTDNFKSFVTYKKSGATETTTANTGYKSSSKLMKETLDLSAVSLEANESVEITVSVKGTKSDQSITSNTVTFAIGEVKLTAIATETE